MNPKNSFRVVGVEISNDFIWHHHVVNLAVAAGKKLLSCLGSIDIFIECIPMSVPLQCHGLQSHLEKFGKLCHPTSSLSSFPNLERSYFIIRLCQVCPDSGIRQHQVVSLKRLICIYSSPNFAPSLKWSTVLRVFRFILNNIYTVGESNRQTNTKCKLLRWCKTSITMKQN